ncbi:MAG: site-2 protease family protein [Phycisphaeraceae bacterium]|nr:site-2 protease family protein [Phycisphaeraceae bacterium]
MNSLLGLLGTALDLALVIVGFGLIVFVHELGHFLAARWAGIRVLAFAIGFGPAIVSYRKGLGWRRGSTEREYTASLRASGEGLDRRDPSSLSPTEYRINVLPFGGYVRMLGQEDLAPGAVSEAPDSYQNCPPTKRMVVISAGVVMNLIAAMLAFMFVFMVGLETEPAKVGRVWPEGPAATVVAANAAELGVTDDGLRPGDRIVRIGDREPRTFDDVVLAVATASPDRPVVVEVERDGVAAPLRFAITPERGTLTGLLDLGIEPARALRIDPQLARHADAWAEVAPRIGLPGVEPGMRLVSAGGRSGLAGAADAELAFRDSGGEAVPLVFESDDGRRVEVSAAPRTELMTSDANPDPKVVTPLTHLLGLTPVMKVGSASEGDRGYAEGLREGDVFARVGTLEFPSIAAGRAEIQRHAGRTVPVVVLRKNPGTGEVERVALEPSVSRAGTIGFGADDTARESTLLALPPESLTDLRRDAVPAAPPAAGLITRPGTRVLSVGGAPVADFTQLREALRVATGDAQLRGEPATVSLELELPVERAGVPVVRTAEWTLTGADLAALHALSWRPPFDVAVFELESFRRRATGPINAVTEGVRETHRMMMMTYLTIARLFQGTVKVEHLRGPVGIADLGTRIADRGIIWLIFFLGLISVNLAVINFLPLPIVDGGQFLMLVYEQVRGRPVPIPVQNAVTMAGLLLIGTVFLVVTFHDVARLFGR